MFSGAYLIAAGLAYALGLLLLRGRAGQGDGAHLLRNYTLLSVAVSGSILLIFLGLSAAVGLMSFGSAANWNYPADYLAGGILGWLLALLPLVGVVAPAAIALARRQTRTRAQ